MSGEGETSTEAVDHAAHVAEVEARHPKFGAFLRRALADPEVREAYYAAQSRRDEEDDEPDAGEPGRLANRGDPAGLAGLEGEAGEPPSSSRVEAPAEPAGVVGRAQAGLTTATPAAEPATAERTP